jgi:uncharacterized protein (TIGR00369 family)
MDMQFESAMPFARHCGIAIESATRDEVRGNLEWREELCTTAGVMHGGALMTLADTVGAICAFVNLPEGATTATLESKTNFFRPVTRGAVRATATPVHVGRSTIVVQTDLRDQAGKRVALVLQTQAVISAK